LMNRIAGRLKTLHAKLVQFTDRLTGRIIGPKSHGTRET
jgi:hypothetical protein